MFGGGFPAGFEEMFGGGGMPGGGGRRGRGPPSDDEDDNTEEYYESLGLTQSATETEIKKAFRKLSRKFHPDRPTGDEAKFKEIQEAYETLKDPHKRDLYNQGGKAAVKRGAAGPENIFDAMFGGGGRRGGRGQRQKPKAQEITKVIDVSLEDVFKGPTMELPYKYMTASGRQTCSRCNGRGAVMEVIRQGFMQIQTQKNCSRCDGRGVSFASEKMEQAVAKVHIPPGIRHGDKITLSGEGHSIPGVERGDVKVTIRVRKHKVYERVGADLACKKTLTLQEALCGHTFKLLHVSGNTLVVTAQPGEVTMPACIKKVAEWGLPQKGGHGMSKGHLYIKYDIIFPVQNSISAGDISTLAAVLGRCEYPEVVEKEPEIEVGARCKIINLAQYPQFNNKQGVVFAETRGGRWGIELAGGKQLSVPAEKLELIPDEEPKKKKKKTSSEEDMEEEEGYEEEVAPEIIDGEPDTTPYKAASDAYDEEDANAERTHECRTM